MKLSEMDVDTLLAEYVRVGAEIKSQRVEVGLLRRARADADLAEGVAEEALSDLRSEQHKIHEEIRRRGIP